jgi:hypothetical protein
LETGASSMSIGTSSSTDSNDNVAEEALGEAIVTLTYLSYLLDKLYEVLYEDLYVKFVKVERVRLQWLP